jgi:phosphoribosylaminoimidazolecarboxamide formyltransferase/IMP cyclohydrolase
MFKNALVSVSDKTGLLEFLTPFKEGLRIVSTGGTAQYLRDHGFKVVDISEQTGFPEVMDGRVKTLHPHVHMALLGRMDKTEHVETLNRFGVQNFDLVICNLYPFEEAVMKNSSQEELIEKIDIGGPSMLRSAAKNFKTVTVLCDPRDYAQVSAAGGTTLAARQQLAAKVFAHTSVYDSLVAQKLQNAQEEMNLQPYGGKLVQSLRYGENPQQKAAWYRTPGDQQGLHTAQILQGKELSYNNILDLDAAATLVREFTEPACVAVKHNNPCGVATDKNIALACEKALKADPVSVFGGIVACNREVDAKCAELLGAIFLECIVAPSFSKEAKELFAKKKNLRLLEWPAINTCKKTFELKSVAGGFVKQDPDPMASDSGAWKFLGERPSDEILKDMIFGEKVCASLKSNAIALVGGGQTLGLGMGQVNRVDAVEHALQRLRQHHGQAKNVVLISDAFFPFSDSIELAAKAGIRWVLQPGGSVKDEEVIKAARDLGVQMVLTGQRHFRH